MCPDVGFGIIDVRDVADLHYRALTAPGIRDERYVCSGPFLKMIDVANIPVSYTHLDVYKRQR